LNSNLQLGFSPLAQSSPPGWLTPTGSGLGRSNWPSPTPLSHPSLPRDALANPNHRFHRPTFLPASGELRHHHLGQMLCPSVLYPFLQLDSSDASSSRRSVAGSCSGSTGSDRLRARCLAGFSPGACCATPRWSWCVCTPVEASRCGAPGALGEDIPR
jgi:hypothetical protein